MAKPKFQHINWPVTVRYNIMRGAAAGSLVYVCNLLGFRVLQTQIPEGLLLIPAAILLAFPIGIAAWWLELRGQRWVNLLAFALTLPLLLGDLALYLLNFLVPGLIESENLKAISVSAAVVYVNWYRRSSAELDDIPDTPKSIWNSEYK